MDEKTSLKIGNCSLEDFCRFYISTAFRIGGERYSEGPMPFDIFEDRLRIKVSEYAGISSEEVKYLHHPFHWELFLKDNCSPLSYVQSTEPDTDYRSYVELVRDAEERDVSAFVRNVLENYQEFLGARIRNLGRGTGNLRSVA
ncbi:hypothetical protein GF386_04835 [Candidatus Pacearchaeota archaeon]|nr:hypothetical protein [Candidatus Pacearchaeota archaeon]MBD3283438.1 hypothetical protein [Candidatus Pacearchaeota archaeon]